MDLKRTLEMKVSRGLSKLIRIVMYKKRLYEEIFSARALPSTQTERAKPRQGKFERTARIFRGSRSEHHFAVLLVTHGEV